MNIDIGNSLDNRLSCRQWWENCHHFSCNNDCDLWIGLYCLHCWCDTCSLDLDYVTNNNSWEVISLIASHLPKEIFKQYNWQKIEDSCCIKEIIL